MLLKTSTSHALLFSTLPVPRIPFHVQPFINIHKIAPSFQMLFDAMVLKVFVGRVVLWICMVNGKHTFFSYIWFAMEISPFTVLLVPFRMQPSKCFIFVAYQKIYLSIINHSFELDGSQYPHNSFKLMPNRKSNIESVINILNFRYCLMQGKINLLKHELKIVGFWHVNLLCHWDGSRRSQSVCVRSIWPWW